MKRALIVLICGVLLLSAAVFLAWTFSTPEAPSLARPLTSPGAPAAARGAAAFEGAGFSGLSMEALESHALPWRLVSAALVLDEQSRNPDRPASMETLFAILARFGFLPAGEPVNRPDGVRAPNRDMPFGFSHGDLAPVWGTRVRVANLSCAACHAGVTYDASGLPKPGSIWLGMPNTSLNLEAYTTDVFKALRHGITRPDALMETFDALYPDTGWPERMTTQFLVLPLVRNRLADLADADRPLPFPNGLPGSTNGVAALKHKTGVALHQGDAGDNGIVSIPDLGYRHWRTSLLVDSSYSLPDTDPSSRTQAGDLTPDHLQGLARITSFFTVPSMGVHPNRAIGHVDEATDIFSFLADAYRPMPFPGTVNTQKALAGEAIFSRECAQCHGAYEWRDGRPSLVSYPNWRGDVGTDPLRAETFSAELAATFSDTVYASEMTIQPTGEYAAPPLTGLWASAPYLHNGSVPTLLDLLNPESRPATFLVGGHALDFEKVGLRLSFDGTYPGGYEPFSQPVLCDTSRPGQTNGGHRHGAALSPAQKQALIEYLKLL